MLCYSTKHFNLFHNLSRNKGWVIKIRIGKMCVMKEGK